MSTQLGISVTPGEGENVPAFESFEVRAEHLPAFLGPIVVSNFSVALAERGLQPVMEDGDAIVSLRYVQEDLSAGNKPDTFGEHLDPGGDTRFLAKVVVEVRANGEEQLYWRGSIQRLHTIRPGDYMHTGNASIALLEAFRELLLDYPVNRER